LVQGFPEVPWFLIHFAIRVVPCSEDFGYLQFNIDESEKVENTERAESRGLFRAINF
jgi:hypothetical protein